MILNYDTVNVANAAHEEFKKDYITPSLSTNDENNLFDNRFSELENMIMQDGERRMDLNQLDDSTRYSIDEYYSLINNPNLNRESLITLDNADGFEDDTIIKNSVEKTVLLCDLIEEFQDDPENRMIQYINKSIEVNGKDFLSSISFKENDGKSEITISDGENFVSFDTKTAIVTQCSATPPWGIIQGTIIGALDGDTKDGKIGYTQQHSTGDCWLLAGINALSYTEKGTEIIKDALEYHDGYTIVHLATGDYVVTDAEVTTTKGDDWNLLAPNQYSSGDDDMIIFELAVEKVLDEIANGNIEFKKNTPWYLTSDTDDEGNRESTSWWNSSTEGGWQAELWYLLTGKASVKYVTDKQDVNNILNEFQKNGGEDIALAPCISEFDNKEVKGLHKKFDNYYITDMNGNEYELGAPHAYAIKAVTNDTVTVINPWDSSKEIVLSKEQYIALFDYTQQIDLSDRNPKQDYTSFNVKDENGNTKNYENRSIVYNEKGGVDFIAYDGVDENGKPIRAFDEDGDGIIDRYYQDGKSWLV